MATQVCERCIARKAALCQIVSDTERGQGGSSAEGQEGARHELIAPDAIAGGPCLFCHESGDAVYVPLHFRPARQQGHLPPETPREEVAAQLPINSPTPRGPSGVCSRDVSRSSQGSEPPGGTHSAFATPREADAGGEVAYHQALESHRGCATCWKRWELRQLELAAELGRGADTGCVRCPFCGLNVDIRRGYDAVLCPPCQSAVVAQGGQLAAVFVRFRAHIQRARRSLQAVAMCVVLGLQAFLSLLFWYACARLVNRTVAGGFSPDSEQDSHDTSHAGSNASAALTAVIGVLS